jgi:hypothetical protein
MGNTEMAESANVSDMIGQKAGQLRTLRDEIEALEATLSQKKESKKQLEEREIPELMERAEIEKITFQGIGTIYLKTEPKASVLKENEPVFFQWLKDNGHGDIVKETVHHRTLSSWAKEVLEQGLPVPEIVQVFHQTKAVLRKG